MICFVAIPLWILVAIALWHVSQGRTAPGGAHHASRHLASMSH
jgi:hypothetical protein